jgi:phosphomannomutase/phosphoglucomutase
VNVKRFISEIREDKVIGRSLFAGIALLAIAAVVLWQLVMIDARAQAINVHAGLNMKIAASRVDTYLDNYQQQLEKLASQPDIAKDLAEINNAALDKRELKAAKIITDAESIFYIDRDLQRHKDRLSFTVTQMAESSLRGKTVSPRAIKIDGQWKVLISKTLLSADPAPKAHPAGVILIQLPISGLSFALGTVNVSNGSLVLLQVVPNRSNIVLLTLGEPFLQTTEPSLLQADQITLFDTVNPLWKISFSPTSSLTRTIEAGLPPFWLFFTCANIAMLLVVYLLARFRASRRSLITDIFIEKHNANDALFAGPNNEDLELMTGIEESQLDASKSEMAELEEPLLDAEEPQLDIIEAPVAPPVPEPFVLPDLVFRDYDIRGIAGTEVTPEFALRLGKTIGTIILQNGHTAIYIGRDGRLSSPELAEALQAGLLSTGCNVINLGEITTPVLNFAVHHCGQSSCGIMITASHNPAVYNGFKIIIQRQVISGKALQLLKPMLIAEKFTRSESGQQFSREIISQYVRHIVENSSIDRSFRLVIDAGNSVAGPVALKLFDSLGCLAFPINCDVDGSFPNHEPNPADEENLKQLISKVKEVKADLGLAFDGDGDRLVVISGKGQIIWPDQLMMIFARDILKRNPGADIVFDVKSSKRLAEIVRKHSGRPVMCKTGHSHIRKAVHHNKAPLGGEFSGHIFFNDRWKGFDDGLYAATRLLEILCSQCDSADKTLDQIIGRFDSSSYTSEILIPVPDDEKFEIMQTLLSGCQFGDAQIVSLDGLRAEYPYGWGLIRASNTSANLTLRFEADDDASLEQVKQAFRRELLPFINQIEDFI